MKNNLNKQVGVWLDHSEAYFIDLSKDSNIVEKVNSDQESHLRIAGEQGDGVRLGNNRSTNNEHQKHSREQELSKEYYDMLADRLKNFDDILLFGSTHAKDELYNELKSDKHFDGKTISVKPADHLTENQMIAEVRKHFDL
ncbi:MAG: hypothetical protein K0M56_00320 [Kaistella sp.]|nr:hypothetical protein [Kaistella sp.]